MGDNSKRYCEDCAFYTRGMGAGWDRCSKFPMSSPPVHVRRDAPAAWGYCEEARANELRCGVGAKGFEKKQAVTT